MEVNLSASTGAQLKVASKRFGFDERMIVERALTFYLSSLGKQADLRKELSEWDSLSDAALLKFENSL